MQVYQMRRPAICCSCTVRPSAIRSLELPHRVFPQNSSSSAHTSSHTKASHQVQELTLLSINLVCGIHEEKGDELFEHTAAIVCTLCRPDLHWVATWQRYLWGRTSVSGWIFRSVTGPSWVHRLQTHGQDRFRISHTAPGDAHHNIVKCEN